MAALRSADSRWRGGPLEGLPLGIKDLFCTKGTMTTASSHILDGFVPAYESTVTANLWRDGAVMLGKLNCDEFAMGSSNETSFYGPVINPWRRASDGANLCPAVHPVGRRPPSPPGSASVQPRPIPVARYASPARFTGICRPQTHLRAVFAVGHRGVCIVARPGRPLTRTVRDAAIMLALHGRP